MIRVNHLPQQIAPDVFTFIFVAKTVVSHDISESCLCLTVDNCFLHPTNRLAFNCYRYNIFINENAANLRIKIKVDLQLDFKMYLLPPPPFFFCSNKMTLSWVMQSPMVVFYWFHSINVFCYFKKSQWHLGFMISMHVHVCVVFRLKRKKNNVVNFVQHPTYTIIGNGYLNLYLFFLKGFFYSMLARIASLYRPMHSFDEWICR